MKDIQELERLKREEERNAKMEGMQND